MKITYYYVRHGHTRFNEENRMQGITDSPLTEMGIAQGKAAAYELIQYLGLPCSTFTGWKYDGIKSYMKYIERIAEFLDVPKDYLLNGGTHEFQQASLLPSEIETYRQFHELTKEQQKEIIRLIWMLHEAGRKNADPK